MWFIIATVKIQQESEDRLVNATTQELYGPFEDDDSAERAARILRSLFSHQKSMK